MVRVRWMFKSLVPLALGLFAAAVCGGNAALTITQRQTNYRVQNERVSRNVSFSGDKSDSYYNFTITDRSGPVQIDIPVGANGQAQFVTTRGGRAVPVSFECDYSAGAQTRGTISIRYRDPQNLYGRISGEVQAVCVPMTAEEVTQQKAGEQAAQEELEKAKAAAIEEQARRAEADRQKAEAAAQQERERDNLRREDAQRREAAFAAEQQKTKPPCTDVIVSGFIASSVMDVEALHAAHLSPEDLEDVLARHPYSCQINSFGVAFGCRGGAQVHGRRATVKNWTATHYVIEIPLDFQMGRRDAPAWVRRSEARCRR